MADQPPPAGDVAQGGGEEGLADPDWAEDQHVRGVVDEAQRGELGPQQLREVWPDVVDNLSSAIRAGLSLPEAVGALAVRGPELLRPPSDRFAAGYRATGRFHEWLDRLKVTPRLVE
jgi:hypothetical protein